MLIKIFFNLISGLLVFTCMTLNASEYEIEISYAHRGNLTDVTKTITTSITQEEVLYIRARNKFSHMSKSYGWLNYFSSSPPPAYDKQDGYIDYIIQKKKRGIYLMLDDYAKDISPELVRVNIVVKDESIFTNAVTISPRKWTKLFSRSENNVFLPPQGQPKRSGRAASFEPPEIWIKLNRIIINEKEQAAH